MAHYVIFIDFFKVTWHKNVTSHVKTEHLSQKRNFIRNVLQSTRSFWSLPVQKLWPIIWFSQKWWPWPCLLSDFQKKNCPWSLVQKTSSIKISGWSDQRCDLYIAKRQKNRQTDKQTNRQRWQDRQTKPLRPRWPIYFRKSKISKSKSWRWWRNESRSESGYFAKPLSFNCVIDIDCDKSMSNVKGQRSKAKGQRSRA